MEDVLPKLWHRRYNHLALEIQHPIHTREPWRRVEIALDLLAKGIGVIALHKAAPQLCVDVHLRNRLYGIRLPLRERVPAHCVCHGVLASRNRFVVRKDMEVDTHQVDSPLTQGVHDRQKLLFMGRVVDLRTDVLTRPICHRVCLAPILPLKQHGAYPNVTCVRHNPEGISGICVVDRLETWQQGDDGLYGVEVSLLLGTPHESDIGVLRH
ncbi:BQ5605_C014g07434 [Microbotryum silenes-dioicae]|uniref:BQ5605_C014g07434 protein n=1 Tax=Microbotryum silenes-dioicae TaxID=796604 RepID=A0A2X0LXM6_9BASI|nr:BQ5605_C014g07434 [Microbotryum silenes-dioicae]